jgi:hypothetical protein
MVRTGIVAMARGVTPLPGGNANGNGRGNGNGHEEPTTPGVAY